jgi:carbamoyltransferase
VLGIGFGFHNSGVALVRVSSQGEVELICNEEEERYTGVKHCSAYPVHSIEAVRLRMEELDVKPADLAACVSNWDYAKASVTFGVQPVFEEAPASMRKQLGS